MKHSYTDHTGERHEPDYDLLDSIAEEKSENERLEKAQEITKEEFEKILDSSAPCRHEHKTFDWDIGCFVCDECNVPLYFKFKMR